ncbi:oxygenase MpaB family protein [Psychrobacter sp. I-STPA10]|uniref:oxygenase MpaB family protein n=1 Tax=Psychrobacter sp. I-STPA10 TaxID=2585769 RepID=UPI001E2AA4B4|nr:oxygenase MpaB family protein [Psychrobacter sp. I-STPA10]
MAIDINSYSHEKDGFFKGDFFKEGFRRHGRTTSVDEHANLQVLKRIRKYLLPKDFQISPQLLSQMADGYDIGDPITDNLLAQNIRFSKPLQAHILHSHTGGTQIDSNYADNNTDNETAKIPLKLSQSSEFLTLTEQFSQHPDWFEPKLAEIGAIAYRRYPLMLIWLLRNVALMAGYSIPALSLPLIKTGALVHDALPRLMRTYAYILAVSEYPELNGLNQVLAVGSEGWRQSINVRQIHTMVRQKLLKDGWDTAYWGIPINQTDMVATHLQFSLLIMRGLKILGARISDEEAAGILHLWQLASWWLGIDLQRIPDNEQACWEWLYTYLAIQHLDFEFGKPLAQALHDLPTQIMGEDNRRGRFVELVNASVTRTLVGDDIGDGLSLPKSRWRFGVLASVPLLFGLDSARLHSQMAADKLSVFRSKRQDNMNWWLKQHDKYYQS